MFLRTGAFFSSILSEFLKNLVALQLKDFMYSTVYVDKDAKREEKKVDKMIEALYERLCADPTLMPNFYMQVAYHQGMDRAVADYISGMSDEFATRLFEELFVPQKWQVL